MPSSPFSDLSKRGTVRIREASAVCQTQFRTCYIHEHSCSAQMRKLRLREVTVHAHIYTAGKPWSPDSNTGLIPESWPLTFDLKPVASV